MSNRTATMSAPAIESSTTTTMSILAIDLGKFKSVACRYDPATGEHAFETIATTPAAVHDLLIAANPTVLVIEACSVCGWIHDLAETLGIEVRVANVMGEPWKWKRAIYEIPGARDVAIEFRSFSKTAGFTGTRCAFTVVPRSLKGRTADGSQVDLYRLWMRRHTTKFNGVSYIVQRGAEAVYSPAGKEQTQKLVAFYLENAKLIREGLLKLGLKVFGGVNAPYVWVQTPGGATSWAFFDTLLRDANVVCTPGSGFGAAGEGFVRLSAFNTPANVIEALRRLGSIELAQ